MGILRGLLGLAILMGIAYLFSKNRKNINWRTVSVGLIIQLIISVLVIHVPQVRLVFAFFAKLFVKVLDFSKVGSTFLFQDLMNVEQNGFIFAIQILPTIIFFSALTALMYHYGILQGIIKVMAWVMRKTMKISGVEGLIASANIFIGQSETPLLIKPYLKDMTPSQIFSLMVCGFATIAGGVMAISVEILSDGDPAMREFFAMHLMSASVMSAPAALLIAKIMFPAEGEVKEEANLESIKFTNGLDAISHGTVDGLKLSAIIGAVLIVFVSLVAMFNEGFMKLGDWMNINQWIVDSTNGQYDGFKLEYIMGLIGAPISFVMGVDSADLMLVGQLIGEKTILNEVIAYDTLAGFKSAKSFTSEKSVIIATYALCGFANIGSIGIQIGGIAALAPSQRATLSKLGVKALIGGSLACFMTATVAGMLS